MHCPRCGAAINVRTDVCISCGFAFSDSFWSELSSEETVVAGADDTTTQQIGLLLDGHYRVDRFVARGGMGEVFKGTDTKLMRAVAIKFLAQNLQYDKAVVQRFVREAQAAASIDHPNIISVYAVGEQEGRPFIVMKYVEGETLTALIRTHGRLPLQDAVHIAVQVCDGLTAIHARGFVHRDIKPHNVMVENDGRALILDFGILRLAGSDITTTGAMAGTPAYLSPEQAKDSKSADARSDLYSLAVSFFEMVTGRLPFQADSGLDMMLKHYTEPPPPASSIVPELAPGVDQVIAKCLAKDPAQRYQSAAELKAALVGLVSPDAGMHPSFAMSGSVPPTMGTWSFGSAPHPTGSGQRAPTGPGATSIHGERMGASTLTPRANRVLPIFLVAILLAGGAVGVWYGTRSPGPKPPAVAPPAPVARVADAGAASGVIGLGSQGGDSRLRGMVAAKGGAPDAGTERARIEEDAGIQKVGRAATRVAPSKKSSRLRRRSRRRKARVARTIAVPAPVRVVRRAARRDATKGFLKVTSSPSGAMVKASGRAVGETPLEGSMLDPGRYTLAVGKAGYKSWTRSIAVRAGKWSRFKVDLQPLPGKLHVVTTFAGRGIWAHIFLDGTKAGTSHFLKKSVMPGTHTVRIERPGYKTISRRVVIKPGAYKKVSITLERG